MASMNEKDYYAILEVSETATTEEIRKAFQVKARKLHPDVNKAPDAEARFKEVSEADFEIRIPFHEFEAHREAGELPIRLTKQPERLSNPILNPEKIEFILEQR